MMYVYRLVKLALAAATLLGQSVIAQAACHNPSVRREWRSLSDQGRAEWISAVKCLTTKPHDPSLVPLFNNTSIGTPPINTSSSLFDDWVYAHIDLSIIVHYTARFLPWHRAYVKGFEIALQEKCGYTGTQPYWDWTLDASNFVNSTFWDKNATSGIGGWGDPNDDYQITDGGFATNFSVSYPSPHRPRRQYTPADPDMPGVFLPDSFTPESQMAIVNGFVGDFVSFQVALERGSHGAIHNIVGGDLQGECPSDTPAGCTSGLTWTPNDPLFMLHHGMIDKLWYDWQNANPANFWAFSGGAIPDDNFPNGGPPSLNLTSRIPTDGILDTYIVRELMDTRNEKLCYIYE